MWQLSEPDQAHLHAMYAPIQHARHVLLLASVPRNDLLGHPRVMAIMTDASHHSVYEALYHGKPLFAVPLSLVGRQGGGSDIEGGEVAGVVDRCWQEGGIGKAGGGGQMLGGGRGGGG